jgi:tRNA pseudouridine38-40 synthase
MATHKLILEYDGTAYAGWQRQVNQPTVQAALEAAIEQITQTKVPVVGAGRTDAGVHALGQVVSFRSEKPLSASAWERALNGLLPDDISIRSVEPVADEFHARYSAKQKIYEYRILNRRDRSALARFRAWHVRKPLDVTAMRQAAALLVGRQDFSSFQGSPTDTDNPVCDLRGLEIHQDTHDHDWIRLEAGADRFLKQMVRAIVGTLVEVGHGKRAATSLKDILQAKDRCAAGVTAPPHGLYLMRVDY